MVKLYKNGCLEDKTTCGIACSTWIDKRSCKPCARNRNRSDKTNVTGGILCTLVFLQLGDGGTGVERKKNLTTPKNAREHFLLGG